MLRGLVSPSLVNFQSRIMALQMQPNCKCPVPVSALSAESRIIEPNWIGIRARIMKLS